MPLPTAQRLLQRLAHRRTQIRALLLLGMAKLLGDAQALEAQLLTAFFNGGAGDAFADSAAIAAAIGTPANSGTGAPATGLTKLLGDAQALEGDQSKLAFGALWGR